MAQEKRGTRLHFTSRQSANTQHAVCAINVLQKQAYVLVKQLAVVCFLQFIGPSAG